MPEAGLSHIHPISDGGFLGESSGPPEVFLLASWLYLRLPIRRTGNREIDTAPHLFARCLSVGRDLTYRLTVMFQLERDIN